MKTAANIFVRLLLCFTADTILLNDSFIAD